MSHDTKAPPSKNGRNRADRQWKKFRDATEQPVSASEALVTGIIGILLIVAANFMPPIPCALLTIIGSPLIVFAATWLIPMIRRYCTRLVFFAVLGWVIALLGCGAAYFVYRDAAAVVGPVPYTPASGLISEFSSGGGGPPHMASGAQCSLLSDSAYNGRSTIRYERIDHTTPGDGFLRVHFHLLPTEGSPLPYVGIYCPLSLSLPQPKLFDVSNFRGISFRWRLNNPDGSPAPQVIVVLYSRHVDPRQQDPYAFPTYYVPDTDIAMFHLPDSELDENWGPVRPIAFTAFGHPDWVDYPTPLDLHRVYQVGVVIRGKRGTASDGYLDIDSIYFVN